MPAATAEVVPFTDTARGWERALVAFLAEKERRSGSQRTTESYSRLLQRFFGPLGKTPDEVAAQDVFLFAHGIGPSGRKPSAVTINARIACLSSFYRFLIRMEIVTSNPCDRLERPRMHPSPPRGLSGEQARRSDSGLPRPGPRAEAGARRLHGERRRGTDGAGPGRGGGGDAGEIRRVPRPVPRFRLVQVDDRQAGGPGGPLAGGAGAHSGPGERQRPLPECRAGTFPGLRPGRAARGDPAHPRRRRVLPSRSGTADETRLT